jgi:hypothetical protein
MLPPMLKRIWNDLANKTQGGRSEGEQILLDELTEIDMTLDTAKSQDKKLTEMIEKRGSCVMGPTTGLCICPRCGNLH